MEWQPLTPLISQEKKEIKWKTPLQKKANTNLGISCYPFGPTMQYASFGSPPWARLQTHGTGALTSNTDRVAAWGAKSWGVGGTPGASWPSGGASNSCSCRATVLTPGHFKKLVIQAESCCGLDLPCRTFFGPLCINSKAKALLWLLLW